MSDGSELLENAKHEHFAQLVSNGDSAPNAYVLAGYSEKGKLQGSNRLLKKVDVCSRIRYLRKVKEKLHAEAVEEAVHRSGVGKQWILEKLKRVVEVGMAEEQILDKDGNFHGEYKSTNLAAANKALELLGLEEGLFIKRIENGDPGDFERLDEDELERKLAETEAAIRAAEDAIGSAKASSREAKKVKQT